MKMVLICGLFASLMACSEPPAKQVPLPPPEPPASSVHGRDEPAQKPAITISEKLDKLQGELEWVKNRLPKGTAR